MIHRTTFCCLCGPVSCSASIRQVASYNRCALTQNLRVHNVQKVRYFRTVGPKWCISLQLLFYGLRKLWRREVRDTYGLGGMDHYKKRVSSRPNNTTIGNSQKLHQQAQGLHRFKQERVPVLTGRNRCGLPSQKLSAINICL